MIEEFPLSPAIGWRGVFHQGQLHRELANLAFKRRNLCLVLGNNASSDFLVVQFATIELFEPQLDKVSRNALLTLRIAPPMTPFLGTDAI